MKPLIATLLLVLTLCSGLAHGQDGRVYDLTLRLDEHQLPGLLELVQIEDELAGRLTLTLRRTFYVSLRADVGSDQEGVAFRTGSPAHGMHVSFGGDTLSGSLLMVGDHKLRVSGTLKPDEAVSSELKAVLASVPFAPDVLSTPEFGEIFPTFTPDGETMYFGRYEIDFQEQTVMVSRKKDGRWREAEVAPFSGRYSDRAPFIAPDGKRLYLASRRPYPGETQATDTYNIWSAELDADGNPGHFLPMLDLNSPADDYQLTASRKGDIVFTSKREGGFGDQDLYLASRESESRFAVENLGAGINSDDSEISGYLSPDESFMIVATAAEREGLIGNDDLFVSFRTDEGWSELVNLGSTVNSFANEYGASLSPDGRFLFFTSDRRPPADIYRVALDDIPAFRNAPRR